MITIHQDLLKPNDSDIIWHYYSFSQFLYLIEYSKLHFTRADKFEDKWEVLITEKDAAYYNTSAESIPCIRDRETKRIFVNCWTKSEHELALMWKAYTSDKEGIAIKSTVQKLKNCYDGPDAIYVTPVRYIDCKVDSAQPSGMVLNTFWFSVTKRKVFEQEKELRLVYDAATEKDEYEISINYKELIQGVYLAPNAELWFVKLLKKLLNRHDIDEKIIQTSELSQLSAIRTTKN